MDHQPMGANSGISEEMNIISLATLSLPEREFSLDMLLGQGDGLEVKSKGSFETEAWCRAEDLKRAEALKAYPWDERPDCSDPLIYSMHQMLEDVVTKDMKTRSRASATFMRDLRLRFLGATLKFVTSNSNFPARWITLSHPDWWFDGNDPYWDEFQYDPPRGFRSLLRIGGVMTAPGFLIAYLHAQFDPMKNRYQLQYRGICGGEKLQKFIHLSESLDDPRNGPLIRDYIGLYPSTYYVRTTTHEIQNLPRQMSRMMPNGITARFKMPDNSVQIKRVPEPYHSIYLVWADLHSMQSAVVVSGVRIRDQQFVLVDETSEPIVESTPGFNSYFRELDGLEWVDLPRKTVAIS